MANQRGSVEERLWRHVKKTDSCWLWTGSVRGGYGRIREGARKVAVHRLSYRIHHGEPDPSLDVCHTCDTPRCVNPAHLFLGTAGDNMRDAKAKGRSRNPNADAKKAQTHCIHGHEFTPENTYIRRGSDRMCVTCGRAANKAWVKANRERRAEYMREYNSRRTA